MSQEFVFREISGQISVEWLVKDFCALPKYREYLLSSPPFLVGDVSCHIRMFPNEPMHILIGLQRDFPLTGKHHVSYKFKFKDGDELLVSSQLLTYDFGSKLNTSPLSVINKFAIFATREYSRPNFNLRVCCTICVQDVDGEDSSLKLEAAEESNKETVPKMTKGIETFLLNMKDLYISGHENDVTIKVEGKEFKAHRSLLIARSPVFSLMFQHDMSEKASGVINIEDCDPESFNDFLLYIYTGKLCDVSPENLTKLYELSSKYDMPGLKDECLEFLKRNMTVNIFCDVVVLASMYDETELSPCISNFFIHNFKPIFRTQNWKTFLIDHPKLANELFQKVVKNIEE